jgi:hypothetical protein
LGRGVKEKQAVKHLVLALLLATAVGSLGGCGQPPENATNTPSSESRRDATPAGTPQPAGGSTTAGARGQTGSGTLPPPPGFNPSGR